MQIGNPYIRHYASHRAKGIKKIQAYKEDFAFSSCTKKCQPKSTSKMEQNSYSATPGTDAALSQAGQSTKPPQEGVLRREHSLLQPACRGKRGNATSPHPHPHEVTSVLAQSPVTSPTIIYELQRYFQSLVGTVSHGCVHAGGNSCSKRPPHLSLFCYTPELSFYSCSPVISCGGVDNQDTLLLVVSNDSAFLQAPTNPCIIKLNRC